MSRLLSRATKIILYKTLIRPVVSYGAEAWTMTKKEEQALIILEGKYLEEYMVINYENGEWKSRPDRVLGEMSKGENVVKWIRGQIISWLGHLERMEEDRMPKKILNHELEGARRRGRPRKRWKEEVERDLPSAGSEKMERAGGRWEKMEGRCSTVQSPQRAEVPMEEEEEVRGNVQNLAFTAGFGRNPHGHVTTDMYAT